MALLGALFDFVAGAVLALLGWNLLFCPAAHVR